MTQRIESTDIGRGMGRRPDAFQQKVVQAKSKIESRIAIARGLGIEENRPIGARENILGADIAMHQRDARTLKILRHSLDALGAIGVRRSGVEKIRLDAQRHEHFVMGKIRGNILPVGAGPVNAGNRAPNRACEIGIDMAVEQLGFPARVLRGLEIVHGEKMGCLVLGKDARNAARLDAARETEPVDLAVYALHRCQPFRGHPQARQGLLDANPARSKVNAENIARHPASQRYDGGRFVVAGKFHAAQGREDFGNRAHGYVAIAGVTRGVNSRHFEI